MSQENLEAAKRSYVILNDALKSEELGALKLLAEERFDPEIVLKPAGILPESEEVHGRDGAVRFLAAQREAFDTMWLEPQEFVDAGDRVVVTVRVCGYARHSGIKIELDRAHVFTYRGGKVLRMDMYAERADALEAAGLRE